MDKNELKSIKLQLESWSRKENSLPKWNDLPEFDVYMDQVIVLIEKYIGDFFEDNEETILTPSMVNNYVKQKIIPAPSKKKYSRVHLSYLIIICMLKPVMTIQDINSLIEYKLKTSDISTLIDWFSDNFEELFKIHINKVTDLMVPNSKDNEKLTLSDLALKTGIEAAISRNIASFVTYKITKEKTSLVVKKASRSKEEK